MRPYLRIGFQAFLSAAHTPCIGRSYSSFRARWSALKAPGAFLKASPYVVFLAASRDRIAMCLPPSHPFPLPPLYTKRLFRVPSQESLAKGFSLCVNDLCIITVRPQSLAPSLLYGLCRREIY